MAILCGYAAKDEWGKFRGGSPGDQTGREVHISEWYDFGQNVVLRAKDREKANRMAEIMESVCQNDLIGYDQRQRTSLYWQLVKVDFDASKIDKTCETDCSALIAACAIGAGVEVSHRLFTGNLREELLATGLFDELVGELYTKSDALLLRGDIILNEEGHVIMALEDGKRPDLTIGLGGADPAERP